MKQLILFSILTIPFLFGGQTSADKAIPLPLQTKFDLSGPHCILTGYDRLTGQVLAPVFRRKGRVTHAQFEAARRKAKKRFVNPPLYMRLIFPNALAEVLKRIDMHEQTGMIIQ